MTDPTKFHDCEREAELTNLDNNRVDVQLETVESILTGFAVFNYISGSSHLTDRCFYLLDNIIWTCVSVAEFFRNWQKACLQFSRLLFTFDSRRLLFSGAGFFIN